ncbi:MAG: hypothetical protein NE334_13760 [Lentisphaeraceae bacterium]|nr:hypothetical protein [Lentisphaeraceae bacterium]
MKIALLLLSLLVLSSCGTLQSDEEQLLKKICVENGIFNIYDSEVVKFDFNVKKGKKNSKRSWVWKVQEEKAFVDGKEIGLTEKKFVNDTYWLLFPLRAYESRKQCKLTVKTAKAPISGKDCREVTVQYVTGEGHSPNDTYVMYIDSDYKIFEWTFFKGSKKPARIIHKWHDYKVFNGVKVPMMHETADGKFKLFFTNVEIK